MENKYFIGIAVFIVTLSILSGCVALSPSLIKEENLSAIDNKSAYIIVGQKLVTDKTIKGKSTNLTHMSMALHINWDLIKPIKGINLPQSAIPASIFQNGPYYEFLNANGNSHTYRTWVIPEKMIGQESRAVVFANMVASKDGLFIPFHSSLRPFNAGIAPLEKGRNTRALETFKGNAFIIDRPGVYYLGEMDITGVFDIAGGLNFNKEKGGILIWNADLVNDKGQLEKYLSHNGLIICHFMISQIHGGNCLWTNLLNIKQGKKICLFRGQNSPSSLSCEETQKPRDPSTRRHCLLSC